MLSYRHAFHAGNHADVLKHFVLVQLLDYFNQKDKPYWVVDTHAGAGAYRLDEGYATRNAEHEYGISRLWNRQNLPSALQRYLDLVHEFNGSGPLRRYPGSPWFALRLMRPADRLRLFELHSTDAPLLAENLKRLFTDATKRVVIDQADGFLHLKSILPPPPKRGLVLMDPAYEDKRDYLRTVMALKESLARFPTGTFAIWYPQIRLGDARALPEKLKKLPMKSWLHVRLSVCAESNEGPGMFGSGMFVANPPWTLGDTLAAAMPCLTEALRQDDAATHLLEHHENESRA
ncbi:MAG: 23S rRNA (adenine(2030)-N(6))-methyltransferase RlmJ [Rhodocyclaceae bacterium]|nr:23S rRNA (adenine(2030)-N(6))-methyltransferase RlmJ [Rhodocyclaceae bacterium]